MLIRAQNSRAHPLKSFAILFPQVVAVGKENDSNKTNEIKVTVTIRDANGLILPNRRVQLSSSLNSTIISPSDTQITNNNGQAIFYLSSSSPGTAKLTIVDLDSNPLVEIANVPSAEFIQ